MFLQQVRLAGRFTGFLLKAGTRHQVHSPFLYNFIEEVIGPKRRIVGEEIIEAIRKECLESREIIYKKDYGTGSKESAGVTYPITIQQVARKSLSSKRDARRLYRLVRHTKALRILEIGTSLGITTAYLALANPEARIITLEGCPELSKKARSHFDRLGMGNIELIEGRFEDTLDQALDKLGWVDLVFVDGNHRKEAMLEYFSKCLRFSKNETIIIFDDIHSSEEMEQAWEQVKQHDKVRISLDLFFSGWIFLRKESSRQHFRLRYI
jgi:predicted O-methyltransferase YrrM